MRRIDLASCVTSLTALVAFFATSSVQAQVVQLPTFRFFGLSSTVSVPDQGSAYLGGVSRSAMSRSERGLPILSRVPVAGRAFGNRAIAGRTEWSGASVSAYIHDFETMDEELLRQGAAIARRSPPSRQGAANANLATRASSLTARPLTVVPNGDAAGRSSVAELRRKTHSHQQTAQVSARQDFERARELAAAGNPGVAKVYLQRAAKHADPELRSEISAFYPTLSAQASATSNRPSAFASRALAR